MSKFGNEEDNFPFCFGTKIPLSRELEGATTTRDIFTEKTLKLLGFPNEAIHGWEITPLHTPVVSSVLCVCMYVYVFAW